MNNRKFFTGNSVTCHHDGYTTTVFAIVEAADEDDAVAKLRKKFPEQSPASWLVERCSEAEGGIVWYDEDLYYER